MRLPEPLFPILNRAMKMLLNSPLHGLQSGSIMVVYFVGRKSGKRRSTPVRYLREADGLFCLTGRETGWWPNFLTPTPVQLQLVGRRVAATAEALPDDAEAKAGAIRRMLAAFPGDAAYHEIKLKRGEAPTDAQLDHAVSRDVLVRFALNP